MNNIDQLLSFDDTLTSNISAKPANSGTNTNISNNLDFFDMMSPNTNSAIPTSVTLPNLQNLVIHSIVLFS